MTMCWCCRTLSMLKYSVYIKCVHASINWRNKFLSLLPAPIEYFNKPFNNLISCEFNPNFHKHRRCITISELMWHTFNHNDK